MIVDRMLVLIKWLIAFLINYNMGYKEHYESLFMYGIYGALKNSFVKKQEIFYFYKLEIIKS
jgi:hypothetical protein